MLGFFQRVRGAVKRLEKGSEMIGLGFIVWPAQSLQAMIEKSI